MSAGLLSIFWENKVTPGRISKQATSMSILKASLVFVACVSILSCGYRLAAEESSEPFGFAGRETFPIDNFISQLRVADLDGDGLNDMVVVNNSRSKINLLYNQTGKTNATDARQRSKRELNELAPDSRFRIESIASEKRIAALVLEDLNQDKRPDIAYYGDPRELVVQYNQGSNNWTLPKRWPIEDGQLTPNSLVSGDLNGDNRTDLILLGENAIYLLAQDEAGVLAEPERIPFSGLVKSVHIIDINGDQRHDALLVNWESANPFRFRLQSEAGQLGPEIHFTLPTIRSYWADDLDMNGKPEVITISMNSGRAQVSHFVRRDAEPLAGSFQQGQFQVLPLAKTSKAKRGVAWGDINSDQLPDLLVAEPDSGQIKVYLQRRDGTLAEAKTYPSLTGITDLAVLPREGEIAAEVYLISPDERAVGVMRFDREGRAPFPNILPFAGKPLAMALGRLEESGEPNLAVILDLEGKREVALRELNGEIRTQKLSEKFKSNPASLTFHDVNQDGLPDLVVLIPYERIKLLLQKSERGFEEIDVSPPGGTVEQPWLSAADVDGDGKRELLLAQKNFLRAVVLTKQLQPGSPQEEGWGFKVRDQINGTSSNSRIVGAASVRDGTNAIASLFLLDAERKSLTLSQRDEKGVWQVMRNILLPFTEFNELQPVSLGAAEPNSVGFLGVNAVGWMLLSGATWDYVELDGYETPIKDGRLNDVISGDLNQDGRKDLVFLETAKNYLDIVMFEEPGQLVFGNRWQVFEERTFRGRRSDSPEPREAVIAELTGDDKNDLAVIVHDRILLYPQE